MPALTVATTFVSGAVVAAAALNDNIQAPKATADSLDIINGDLDATNLAGIAVVPPMIQLGALSRAGMVGGTGNLDYFVDLWPGLVNDDSGGANETARTGTFHAIPRLAKTFYLPWGMSRVLILWHVLCANDGTNTQRSVLRLFHNGTAIANGRLGVMPSVYGGVRFGSFFQRVWSGHYLLDNPAAGTHSVWIGIGGDAPQSRIRGRGLAVIAFS